MLHTSVNNKGNLSAVLCVLLLLCCLHYQRGTSAGFTTIMTKQRYFLKMLASVRVYWCGGSNVTEVVKMSVLLLWVSVVGSHDGVSERAPCLYSPQPYCYSPSTHYRLDHHHHHHHHQASLSSQLTSTQPLFRTHPPRTTLHTEAPPLYMYSDMHFLHCPLFYIYVDFVYSV